MVEGRDLITKIVGRRRVHPFCARMAASIPWAVLADKPRPLRILDPMMGSGTSLVVARANGHEGIGFDTDPLAVLLAKVWASDINVDEFLNSAVRVATAAENDYCKKRVQPYPIGSDSDTQAFVRYWFDLRTRRRLFGLCTAIAREPRRLQPALWCAFSRLIITKAVGASLAMDVSHSRPHRHYARAPIDPIKAFCRTASRVAEACPFRRHQRLPRPRIRTGDARRIPLPERSVDLIITSPPYLNAIDYVRGHRLSLVWMGHNLAGLATLRASNIGAESTTGSEADPLTDSVMNALNVGELPTRFHRMLSRYIADMTQVLREAARVLVPSGRAVFVIGDSTLRGVYIRNSRIVEMVAAHSGLTRVARRRRAIPDNRRYLPPPKTGDDGLNTRMRTEVVLALEKT
jgi:tRNA G10  N-methylase Trm11